jgi:hypothetical protein
VSTPIRAQANAASIPACPAPMTATAVLHLLGSSDMVTPIGQILRFCSAMKVVQKAKYRQKMFCFYYTSIFCFLQEFFEKE